MSLKTTYQEYILEKLLKEHLYDGEIIASDELESELEEYQKTTHLNLSKPLSFYKDFSVEHGGEASASHIEDIANTVHEDLSVVVRETYRIAQENLAFYERWINEIKRISAKANKAEQRIDSLLLLQDNTAGYYAHVGDDFYDMNEVDTENTTARVDIENGAISINTGTTFLASSSQVDLSGISPYDVSFSNLTRGKQTSTFTIGKVLPYQVFEHQNTNWISKVVSSKPGEIIAEFKATLSKNTVFDVSRILVEWTGPTTSNGSTVTLLYSVDGINYELPPTPDATKAITPRLSWCFAKKSIRFIKLIFRKPAHDYGKYEYLFGIRKIKLYGDTYSQDQGNLLFTSALSHVDIKNNTTKFSKVQLDVCENLPSKTRINYYVSASKNNSTWTDWFNISPANRLTAKYPKVINISGADWKNNKYLYETDLLDSTNSSGTAQMELTTSFDDSDVNGYRFKNNKFASVNTKISVSSDVDIDSVASTFQVWRNVRNFGGFPDTSTVRGVPRGWSFDGKVYSCYFEILSSNGKLLNLGNSTAIIDGREYTGSVVISKGVHKFETDIKNWKDYSASFTGKIISEGDLSLIDGLYPYNHKYLIEGVSYTSGFQGEKIYTGADIFGELYCKNTSLFDLENNFSGFNYFALRNIGSTSPVLSVIVRYDPTYSDYDNELFYVRWRAGETGAEAYKYVKLKAELKTEDSSVSPLLESYRIKLGI